MPNDCDNFITIVFYSKSDQLKQMIELEIESIPDVKIVVQGPKGVQISFVTPWYPDFDMMKRWLDKYPSCWIKNEWVEEGGKAGVWIGSANGIEVFEWDDLSLEAVNDCFSGPMLHKDRVLS